MHWHYVGTSKYGTVLLGGQPKLTKVYSPSADTMLAYDAIVLENTLPVYACTATAPPCCTAMGAVFRGGHMTTSVSSFFGKGISGISTGKGDVVDD